MKVKHTKKTPPSKRLTKKQLKSMVGGAQEPSLASTVSQTGIKSPAGSFPTNDAGDKETGG